MSKSSFFTPIFSLIILSLFLCAGVAIAQERDDNETYLLRWNPTVGATYKYMLSTSGSRGETIRVLTEDFELEVIGESDGIFQFEAVGESVPDSARLGYRFQRKLFSPFEFSVDEYGNFQTPPGQPFPPFVNIPILPEEEVSIGDTWSGGPVGILPDPGAGVVPFTYISTLDNIAAYREQTCAIIETDYIVALPEDAVSIIPFLGLVEGDTPDPPGQGAPVGGVVEGSRAHEAGIEPGDFITAAEGERVRGWGGMGEILPYLVPDVEIEFTVRRGEDEFDITFAPEGIPVAQITATGGMHSRCYFSIERGIPLKVEITGQDLVFVLSTDEESEEREPDLHLVFEYQYED